MNQHMRHWVISAIVAGACLFTTLSHAERCIRGPIALPWLSGPPEWKDFDGDGVWRPELHDPRWSGAPFDYLAYVPGGGSPLSSSEVGVRILTHDSKLYISYQIESDDNGPSGDDYVYLAFTRGSADGAYAIRVDLGNVGTPISAPTNPDPGGPTVVPIDSPPPSDLNAAVSWWETVDSTLGNPAWGVANEGKPTWLQAARWNRPSGSPRWAITLQIDMTGMVGDPKMFLGATIDKSAGDVILGNVAPLDNGSPTALGNPGDTIIPRSSSSWEQFRTSGGVCTSGITLSAADVGVWTGTPGSSSGGSLTHDICTGDACGSSMNVFRATARNLNTSAGISPWDIRARFRIADWTSNPAYRHFGRWMEIAPNPTGTNIFTTPASTFTAEADGTGWHWQLDGTSATIDYKCQPGAGQTYCPTLADPSATQCILVELSQRTSGGPTRQAFLYNATYFCSCGEGYAGEACDVCAPGYNDAETPGTCVANEDENVGTDLDAGAEAVDSSAPESPLQPDSGTEVNNESNPTDPLGSGDDPSTPTGEADGGTLESNESTDRDDATESDDTNTNTSEPTNPITEPVDCGFRGMADTWIGAWRTLGSGHRGHLDRPSRTVW